MTASQQRGWFRLAFVAVAFAVLVSLAPPPGSSSHRASVSFTLSSASSLPSSAASWARWEWPVITHATSVDHAALSAVLPVLFVGLLAPLVLLLVSAATAVELPIAPKLASLFQRPPPAQIL